MYVGLGGRTDGRSYCYSSRPRQAAQAIKQDTSVDEVPRWALIQYKDAILPV